MIQLTSGGASLCMAPAMPRSAPVPQRHLDRDILLHGIAAHRRRLAELETSMVDACERAAVRGACRKVRMHDHDTWDKATWQRYLEAAARGSNRITCPRCADCCGRSTDSSAS